MKRSMKKVLITGMLLIGLMANAWNGTPSPIVKFKSMNTEKYELSVETLNSDVQIQIKDVEGVLLHSKVLNKRTRYNSVYDFSEMPKGMYYVKIVDATVTKVYAVKSDEVTLIVEVENNLLEKKKEELLALSI